MKTISKQSGFTLMELLIVVAIIAVMVGIGLPSYRGYAARANRSQAQQLVSLIGNKQAQYFLDARAYTASLDASGINIATVNATTGANALYEGWMCGPPLLASTACSNGNYTVSVSMDATVLNPNFTITATPKSTGTNSAEAALVLKQDGTKTGPWGSS